ncbi:hypothetical protein ACFV7Q_34115, partial [Streptomyces sp. NPDC059851]
MTHPLRKKRLVLFAAAAAMVAGGAVVPTTAFAAATTPHTVTVGRDDIDGGRTSNLLHTGERENAIQVVPDEQDKKGQGEGGENRPGGASSGNTGVKLPKTQEWQCVKAPCGPPPGKGGTGKKGEGT